MKVNLQKSNSKLTESIVKLYDESGVRRSLTVPYVEGQDAHEHIGAVGQAATEAGGMTKNLLLSGHHSAGKGWGSGDGHTVGFPSDKLRSTLIPKKDPNAIAAIGAAQHHLNNLAALLGKENSVIQTAQGQLNLVKKTDGESMTLLDLGVLLVQIFYRPTQLVAKLHSGTKPGGHAPHLRGPAPAAAPEQQEETEAPTDSDEQQQTPVQQASPAPTTAQQG